MSSTAIDLSAGLTPKPPMQQDEPIDLSAGLVPVQSQSQKQPVQSTADQLASQYQGPGSSTESPLVIGARSILAGNIAEGLHHIMSAAGSALEPLAAPALVEAPIATALAAGGSLLGGYGAKAVANYAGATPDQSDMAGDVGSVAGGVAGGTAGGLVKNEIPSAVDAIRSTVRKIVLDPVSGEPTVTPTSIAKRILRDPKEVENAAYEKKAEALMQRGYEQAKLDIAHEQKLKSLEDERQDQLAAQEKLRQQYAEALEKREADQKALDAAHEERLQSIEKDRQKKLADSEKLKEQDAASRQRRGIQQDRLDKANIPDEPTPFSGVTVPERQAVIPKGGATPAQEFAARQSSATKEAEQAESAKQPSKIALPGSKPPDLKVTYQSYSRERLYEMAKKGDLEAGRELIRNPKNFRLPPNFKYLIEEAGKKPWRNLEE